MKITFNLPEKNLTKEEKIDLIEKLKNNSIDHWCEKMNFTSRVKSGIPYMAFLSKVTDESQILFEKIKDHKNNLYYGKVIVKFMIKEDLFFYNIDFSFECFKNLIKELRLKN